ncbi:protein REVEILLE 8-like isoform X3 [Dendrobium catenatum]|uniref:protein REVEILLE 8-like isoform X3 n=1 Tax=Dendrobium catenatum TaxID=906689 RepID=UPI0009F73FC5|nr:protein REVEILLE 8-like isoform X3 [Dendrobium catenatum]
MLYAIPAAEGGGSEFRGQAGFSADSFHRHHHQQQQQQQKGIPTGMVFQEVLGSITTSAAAEETSSEDPNKKIRKPYTITKSRESWTEQEHDKFLEALQLYAFVLAVSFRFDRDWKKIEAFVGSKTVIQIRSHAQKYFLKVQKNGTSEHVPPPRPKRKAAHPYPQKASKNGHQVPQPTTSFQTSPCLPEPVYTLTSDRSSVIRNSTSGAISSWVPIQPVEALHTIKEDAGPTGSMLLNNSSSSSSTENPQRIRQICETTDQGHHVPSVRDFARVYSFIGNIFDPSKRGHLQKLMEMDPIDVETVLLLMRNLSINLTNPDFEDHRRLLSLYDACAEEGKSSGTKGMLKAAEPINVPFLVKAEQ